MRLPGRRRLDSDGCVVLATFVAEEQPLAQALIATIRAECPVASARSAVRLMMTPGGELEARLDAVHPAKEDVARALAITEGFFACFAAMGHLRRNGRRRG
jgi:hypothetical protein